MATNSITARFFYMHRKNIFLSDDLIVYKSEQKITHAIPFLHGNVAAGFPSSAENYAEKILDLNELLISHPAATFFIRVRGNSMEHAGINNNDILIVDREIAAADNKIVIARIDDELTVKRIRRVGDHLFLMPENPDFRPIKITDDMDFEVWGVVTSVIHQV